VRDIEPVLDLLLVPVIVTENYLGVTGLIILASKELNLI